MDTGPYGSVCACEAGCAPRTRTRSHARMKLRVTRRTQRTGRLILIGDRTHSALASAPLPSSFSLTGLAPPSLRPLDALATTSLRNLVASPLCARGHRGSQSNAIKCKQMQSEESGRLAALRTRSSRKANQESSQAPSSGSNQAGNQAGNQVGNQEGNPEGNQEGNQEVASSSGSNVDGSNPGCADRQRHQAARHTCSPSTTASIVFWKVSKLTRPEASRCSRMPMAAAEERAPAGSWEIKCGQVQSSAIKCDQGGGEGTCESWEIKCDQVRSSAIKCDQSERAPARLGSPLREKHRERAIKEKAIIRRPSREG